MSTIIILMKWRLSKNSFGLINKVNIPKEVMEVSKEIKNLDMKKKSLIIVSPSMFGRLIF